MRKVRLRALLPELLRILRPQRRLLALGALLVLVSRALGLVLPASTAWLVDDVLGRGRGDLLLPLVAGILLATLLQALAGVAVGRLLARGAHSLVAGLRCRVQAHVGRLPVAYFDAHRTGALVSRIMNDVEGLRLIVGAGLVDHLGGVVAATGALVALVWISPRITAAALAVLAVWAGLLAAVFGRLRPLYHERGCLMAEVTGRLAESLAGIRVVKVYNAEDLEAAGFARGIQRLVANGLRSAGTASLLDGSSILVLGSLGALVAWLGGREVLVGALTAGELLAYVAFLACFLGPMIPLAALTGQLGEALAGLERTLELLREPQENRELSRTVALGGVRGELTFEAVSFSYAPGTPVLRHVSFRAEPGTVTALVGPSGGGKSTIIGLAAGFHSPTRGRVLVDGVDLSTVQLATYRAHLGVVLQEPFLFEGTILENVAFARPGAREDEILQACRVARVDEFAERLETGYGTTVGERGVKLSGGQRQRISIAQAVLADPQILILDEATSSLDSESEALVQEALAGLIRGRTTLVIAHRLSTIRAADRILVIQDGRVVEHGRHDSLLALGGRYFDLHVRQQALPSELPAAEPVSRTWNRPTTALCPEP